MKLNSEIKKKVMKNILNNIILFALFVSATLVVSCSEDQTATYSGANYVYFSVEPSEGEEFISSNFTFLFEEDDVTEKDFEIPLSITGQLSSQDRNFEIKIVDSLTTAIEGKHFTINPDKQVIKANQTKGSAVISLNRTADLKDTGYTVGVELITNNTLNGGIISSIHVLNFSDFLEEPDWWYKGCFFNSPQIGPFTVTKALLWFKYNNITDGSDPWLPYFIFYDDFSDCTVYDGDSVKAIVAAFKIWLSQLPDAPIIDENGDEVLNTFN